MYGHIIKNIDCFPQVFSLNNFKKLVDTKSYVRNIQLALLMFEIQKCCKKELT